MNPQEHPHVGTIVPFTAATSSTVEETRADHGGTNGTGNAVALKLKKVPQDQWVKNALTRQFPPPLFLKLLERSPYEPLQKSYRNSNELPEVVKGAPIIRIGITFLAGGDGPTGNQLLLRSVSLILFSGNSVLTIHLPRLCLLRQEHSANSL